MFRKLIISIATMLAAIILPGMASAGPDQYVGDTAIYGGAPTVVQPNVLIIVDNSGSMSGTVPGDAYDPATTYTVVNHCGGGTSPCATNGVYTSSQANFLNAGLTVADVTTSCGGANPQNLLLTTGQYSGTRLRTNGTCRGNGNATYLLGNYINWSYTPAAASRTKISIAKEVVKNLISSTHGINIGLMTYHYDSGIAQGSQFLDTTFHSQTFVTTVSDMTTTIASTYTNRDALMAAVDTITLSGNTPVGEAVNEAMRYFQGETSAYDNTIGLSGSPLHYTSPIQYGCQKNYVIMVTDGMANADNTGLSLISTTYGNTHWDGGFCSGYGNPAYTTCNGSDQNHSVAGVARYMYENDLRPDAAPGGLPGLQNVTTYTIGFGDVGADAEAVDLLRLAADTHHGHGNAYLAGNQSALSSAFTSIVSEIFSVDTSFVAPVVPVSPENRTYSGSRVYMGFFKPDASKFWSGNLKKLGLGSYTVAPGVVTDNHVLDANGHLATYVTSTDPQHDDRDHAIVPVGASNGSFRLSSQSYWSTTPDAGNVEDGGVGDVLLARTTARNIYSFLGSNVTLADPSNAFSTSNISETQLGFTAGDTASRDKLVNFLQGLDAYDTDPPDTITNVKRHWTMGDILHSKPQIVSYGAYSVATDEANCSVNKTMIFAGANDGMIHAFKDCDGSEAWAFIPPDLLPVLQYLGPTGAAHTYFVDFSPTVYIYNKMKDGTINPSTDKVFLFFGLRRGGGIDSSPTKGYYYALDVTDPLNPQFLWSISNTAKRFGTTTTATTDFSELGESWSDVTFGNIKLNTGSKIALFVGAGYDNCNEDGRYGPTQTYTGSCVSIPTGEYGATTSLNGSAAINPTGRGVFIIDVATPDVSGIPQATATSGNLIRSFTATNTTGMTFSIPGRVKAFDTNFDGYVDRLYAGDVGGNLWRFDIKGGNPGTDWSANKIFRSNPGADASTGRKMFYEPSGFVLQDGTMKLYFGTGDREHPLNMAVVDRIYSVIDRGQTTGSGINEANMVDVTGDTIQGATTTASQAATIISQLTSSTNYGWYIKLDQNTGEKVLAPSLLFNGVVVYTTYSPTTTPSVDPCVTGNLGTGRAYLVDYLTGASVVNFDSTNDTTSTTNPYANPAGNYNLFRSDRVVTLGSGIPSGAVMVISQSGQTTLMVGVGGTITTIKGVGGGVNTSLYWRQKIEYQ